LQKTLDAQFSKHKQKALGEYGGPQSPFLWHSQWSPEPQPGWPSVPIPQWSGQYQLQVPKLFFLHRMEAEKVSQVFLPCQVQMLWSQASSHSHSNQKCYPSNISFESRVLPLSNPQTKTNISPISTQCTHIYTYNILKNEFQRQKD